jgi:hypothetical protein
MLQKVAHSVEGLKSVSQPALKSILSRVYLVHASLVGGVVGFIVIVLCLVTGPIVYTVQALVRKLCRRSVSRPRNSMFMTDQALTQFQAMDGWKVGIDGSITVTWLERREVGRVVS